MTESVGPARVIVALDAATTEENLSLVARLRGEAQWFKVGLRQFYQDGAAVIAVIREAGASLFLDLKLHDIPETVGTAAGVLARWRPELLTVHASGGSAMVQAAVQALREADSPTKVLGVTVLTSMVAEDLAAFGGALPVEQVVENLARQTMGAGADGLVCSAQEAARLRALVPDALLVTPGIRPAGAAVGDQRRVMGPGAAVAAGADLLVVGRPITQAADPVAAFRALAEEAVPSVWREGSR